MLNRKSQHVCTMPQEHLRVDGYHPSQHSNYFPHRCPTSMAILSKEDRRNYRVIFPEHELPHLKTDAITADDAVMSGL